MRTILMRETWHPSSPSRLANVFELEFGDGGGGEEYKRIPLFRWIRKFVTIASTDTLYGPEKDPMRDAEVMNGLWYVINHLVVVSTIPFACLRRT